MAAASKTETWDAAWTLTARAKRKRLSDNISDSYPTIGRFRKSGVIEVESGGKEIQEDLMYALGSSEWFDGYDELDTSAVDGITAAFYNFCYNATPVSISMTEEQESKASDKAVKLITAKLNQAMTTAFDTINSAAHGASSGKAMLGLQDIVASSTGTTLGGINSSNETWWEAGKENATSDTNFRTKSGEFYQGILRLGSLWNTVSEGNDKPDIMITGFGLGGNYEDIFEGTGFYRWTSGKPGLDGRNPTFRGVEIIYARACADTRWDMLQSKEFKLKIQSGLNFSKTAFREPHNQMAKVAFVLIGVQMTTNNRRRQGVVHNLVAA